MNPGDPQRVLLVPVRHHSPACARTVRDLIRDWRPEAVLIEGPGDFNPQLSELQLPHRLPVAIYSYVRLADGARCGAYYPFCDYSPEWQALRTAQEIGASIRFIDLPWAALCSQGQKGQAHLPQRYAEPQLRYSQYVRNLCAALGVDDFDALWDELFEIDPELPAAEYLVRANLFCAQARSLETVSPDDQRREAFMASELLRTLAECSGRILVVTGGFHTPALQAALAAGAPPPAPEPAESEPPIETGIALTPYSYERLDRLTGYEAGMPGPGFYHRVWQARGGGQRFDSGTVLAAVVAALRRRKQLISAADVIACQTTAQTLAAIRGHAETWRRDLVDAMRGCLIKDEVARGGVHPLLEAIAEVFRGDNRGRLAEGTALPPLVGDILSRLEAQQLMPAAPVGSTRFQRLLNEQTRTIELDFAQPAERERSRLLHLLLILRLPGFTKVDGTDMASRQELSRVWERWEIVYSPELHARIIEASRYGARLPEAAAMALAERLEQLERDFAAASGLLVEAALAGLGAQSGMLCQRLEEMLKDTGDFLAVATGLGHLMYLHRYDQVLEMEHRERLAPLLRETAQRGLWLLEGCGAQAAQVPAVLAGLRTLLEVFEQGQDSGLQLDELAEVLGRIEADPAQGPQVRGAAVGILWTLRRVAAAQVLADLKLFSDPVRLGDFLSGLFALAREAAQREPELLQAIDALICGFSEEEFLLAAPALRLAHTYFTPREKHHMATTLLKMNGQPEEPAGAAALPVLSVAPETALRALAFEARLFETLQRYGIRTS